MRIALVSQAYPPETAHGGISTQTYAKAHALVARGHDVHVITQSVSGKRYELPDGKVRVTRVSGAEHRMNLRTDLAQWMTYSAAVAAEIEGVHASTPLDIVDFPEWACEAYVHLLNQTEWSRIPTTIQLHGPLVMLAHTIGWPETDSELYRVGTHMEATCLRLADAVYSSSDLSADWVSERYGVDRDSIQTIHLGVDTALFRPGLAPRSERPTIVFVGRIARSKGVEILCDAALLLVQEFPKLRLRLIGQDPDGLGRELQQRALAAGVPQLLELAGFVDGAALPVELCQAHVFAAPSVYEGGPGLVALEAMACSLPVVASGGSGVSEIVRHGETGLLVRPDDLRSLVAALRRLLAHDDERVRVGEAGREHVVATAGRSDCVERLEQLYESVVSRTPVGS